MILFTPRTSRWSKAQLEQDKAGEVSATANLEQAKAKAVQADADWQRAQKLGPQGAIAPQASDSFKAAYDIAKANVNVAEAALTQSKATSVKSEATLNKAQRNLDFCTIKSPVKGVIIDRRVNIGQTVVSSLNAPSLFLIAKDLTRMQIWVAVNEADVGRITPGAPVTFTCDTFPGREFKGTVGKIRLNATMTQNVVMYTVEVNTENPDRLLLPYLTANVRFVARQESKRCWFRMRHCVGLHRPWRSSRRTRARGSSRSLCQSTRPAFRICPSRIKPRRVTPAFCG
jgi:HlyD family secretion protein